MRRPRRRRAALAGPPAGPSLYCFAHDRLPSSPLGCDAVNAEFSWWLLIVGLVLGAALTWLVIAETTRTDADLTDTEQRGEALWIASVLTSSGRPTDDVRVEEILQLHREYLAAPPPDDPPSTAEPTSVADAPATEAPAATAEPTTTTWSEPIEQSSTPPEEPRV